MNLAEINMILKIEKEFMLLAIFCLKEEARRKKFQSLEIREASLLHLKRFFPWLLKYQKIPTLPNENLVPEKNYIGQKNFMKTPILHNYIFVFT